MDYIFLLLPIVLWPISFRLLKSVFVYAMFCSTLILALISLYLHRKIIPWKRLSNPLLIVFTGIFGAIILSAIFFLGNFAATAVGLHSYVAAVYTSLYNIPNKIVLAILLAFIAIFEEIYWRGALQAFFEKNVKAFAGTPWILGTAYYTLVHIATLNPILVIAAFAVGLVTSIFAYRYGILSSIIIHILWIEAVVMLPLIL